jgi:hypothetical protein
MHQFFERCRRTLLANFLQSVIRMNMSAAIAIAHVLHTEKRRGGASTLLNFLQPSHKSRDADILKRIV